MRIEDILDAVYATDIVEPQTPVPEGAEVISVLPNDLLPLGSLMWFLEQKLENASTSQETAQVEADLQIVRAALRADIGRVTGRYPPMLGFGVAEGWLVWVLPPSAIRFLN